MKARIGQCPNHSRTQEHWSRTREGRREEGGSAVGRSLAPAVRLHCPNGEEVGRPPSCVVRGAPPAAPLSPSRSLVHPKVPKSELHSEKSGWEQKEKDRIEGKWVKPSLKTPTFAQCIGFLELHT